MIQTFNLNMGWTCPGCSRCFSPSTAMCWFCPAKPVFTTTTVTQPVTAPAPVNPLDPLPYIPFPGPTPPTINPWQPPSITWTYPTSSAPQSMSGLEGYMLNPATSGYMQVIPCPTGQCDPMHNYTCAPCETKPSCGCDIAAGGHCSQCD